MLIDEAMVKAEIAEITQTDWENNPSFEPMAESLNAAAMEKVRPLVDALERIADVQIQYPDVPLMWNLAEIAQTALKQFREEL